MNRFVRHAAGITVAFALLVSLLGSAALAGSRWIDETSSSSLVRILRDDVRDRIYVLDAGAGEVVVLDSESESVAARIPVVGEVRDMALSKSGAWLAVASTRDLTRINLDTFHAVTFSMPVSKIPETEVRSIAFDWNEDVFVVTSEGTWGWIYHVAHHEKVVLRRFGVGPNLDQPVFLGIAETDPTGTVLYVGETELPVAEVHQIDVSSPDPAYLGRSDDAIAAADLKDLAASPTLPEFYVASSFPYGIQVFDAGTLEFLDLLATPPVPVGVDVDAAGAFVFELPGDPYDNFLYKFDAATRTLAVAYPLLVEVTDGSGQDRGLAIDRTGAKAFVIHGNRFQDHMKVQVIDVF